MKNVNFDFKIESIKYSNNTNSNSAISPFKEAAKARQISEINFTSMLPTKGKDISLKIMTIETVKINAETIVMKGFKQSYKGTDYYLAIRVSKAPTSANVHDVEECPYCESTGHIRVVDQNTALLCPACNGVGNVSIDKYEVLECCLFMRCTIKVETTAAKPHIRNVFIREKKLNLSEFERLLKLCLEQVEFASDLADF